MSAGRRTVVVFLTVISILCVAILGLAGDWPLRIWVPAAAALVGVAMLLGRVWKPSTDPLSRTYDLEPDLPIPPPEKRAHEVRGVALASALPDYDFLFSATIRWCPLTTAPHAPAVSATGLAVSAVLARAEALTRDVEPQRNSLAQHQLSGLLGVMEPDPTGRFDVMAEDVVLTLAEADADRLARLSTVRKEEAVWEHERKHEYDKRAYLGGDVLKNTGNAVVWWLSKNEDQIKRTVDDIGVLAQLSAAANNEDVPDRFQHMVPHPVPEPEPDPVPVFPLSPTDKAFMGDPTPPPDSPVSPADLFGALLDALGFPVNHPQTPLLARGFVHTVDIAGGAEGTEEILVKFDTADRFDGDGDSEQDEGGGDEPAPP